MPARTSGDDFDLRRLVATIVLDCHLLAWFAQNSRSVSVLAAIEAERRKGSAGDFEVLDFLERWVSTTQ